MANYYQILGINRNAGIEEIKRAYRKLALQYHPDKNKSKNAESMFILIHQAYQTLTDSKKREQYNLSLDFGISIELLKKKEEKAQKEREKKYGTAHKYDTDIKNRKKGNTFSKKDEKQFEQLEKFMFFVLIIISFYGVVLGFKHMFFEEWENFDHPVAGLIFALLFPTLLIYGYRVIYKRRY
jgi:DnaJ-class molecular chaperone